MNKLWVPSAGLFSLLWAFLWVPLLMFAPYEASRLLAGVAFFGWLAGVVMVTVVRRKRARGQ